MAANGFEVNLVIGALELLLHFLEILFFSVILFFQIAEQSLRLIEHTFKQLRLLLILGLLLFLNFLQEVFGEFVAFLLVVFVKGDDILSVLRLLRCWLVFTLNRVQQAS